MDKQIIEKVEKFVNDNRETIVSELFELCRIPSVRGEAEEGAPFGRESARALAKAVEIAERYGFQTELFADDGFAVSSYGDGEKTIAVMGHADVVPAGDGWTKTEPFEPVLKDGCLYGRGVRDDKGGILAGIYVQRAAKELGLPIKSKLITFAGSCEETGMRDIKSFAEKYKMPDLSMVADSDFSVCFCEKDIFDCHALSKAEFAQIKDFQGGVVMNAVPGKAFAVFDKTEELYRALSAICEKDADFALTEKDGELTITATGISTHAAYPVGSRSAVYILAKELALCPAVCENDRKILMTAAEATSDYYGEGIGVDAEDELTGKMICVAGLGRTVDKKLKLSFNCRVCHASNEEKITAGFRKFFTENGWEILSHSYNEGYFLPTDHPYIVAMLDAYKEITGIKDAKPYVMGGGTYARYLKNAFAFGYSTQRSVGDVPVGHGKAHQPDESVRLDSLLEAFKIYILSAIELDKVLNA